MGNAVAVEIEDSCCQLVDDLSCSIFGDSEVSLIQVLEQVSSATVLED